MANESSPVVSPMVEMNDLSVPDHLKNESTVPCEQPVRMHEDDFIFESTSVHFNLAVFLKQFSAHIILPLCGVFTNLRGQGIITNNWWVFSQNAGACIGVYVVLATYYTLSAETQEVLAGAWAMPLIFFLQHRLIIALKYATLSDKEYDKFMKCTDVDLCMNYNLQMQLLSSWSQRDETVLEFEMGSAAIRIGAQINEIYFNIWEGDPPYIANASPVIASKQANFHHWNALIRGHKVIDTSVPLSREFFENDVGGYSISVYDVVKAIIRRADSTDSNKKLVYVTILLFDAFNLMIPFIHLIKTHKHVPVTGSLVVFLYLSTVLNFFFCRVCYLILCTAVWDVLRQANMVITLHKMLRLSDMSDPESQFELYTPPAAKAAARKHDTANVANIMSIGVPRRRYAKKGDTENPVPAPQRISEFAKAPIVDNGVPLVPRLELNCPHNVLAWTYARIVIQNFGERYRFRIDTYTGGSALLIFCLMLGALLHVVLASDHQGAFRNCLFQQIVVSVCCVITFLVVVSVSGAKVNDELTLHSRTLTAHLLKIRTRILDCMREDPPPTEEVETLQVIAENLDSMMEIIDVNTELKPFKLFGFTASNSITASILSSALSFFGILISYSGQQEFKD